MFRIALPLPVAEVLLTVFQVLDFDLDASYRERCILARAWAEASIPRSRCRGSSRQSRGPGSAVSDLYGCHAAGTLGMLDFRNSCATIFLRCNTASGLVGRGGYCPVCQGREIGTYCQHRGVAELQAESSER